MIPLILSCVLGCAAAPVTHLAAQSMPASRGHWAGVLARYVVAGGVDYGALAADRRDLDSFLDEVSGTTLASVSGDGATAFWINAYNAVVLGFVLERYPQVESVLAVPGFFDAQKARVAGLLLTLDEIEARALAGGDARVHFALVCAAASCPDLRPEPYSARQLDDQLNDQARRFLADPDKGARLDGEGRSLWLSSLFDWYSADFIGAAAPQSSASLVKWILPFLPAGAAERLAADPPKVDFLDYDWALNDRSAASVESVGRED